ncbi:folate-binding protein YgfZ [Baekduia soli]|uniref:Folate-binding protein YgfZ n=1 Tax=Baekduia soli TaxID=496014 RepID=A0A5B8U676_9ACTN|nr:glycine cleavage T C-terminal barrel domain-containing protein [Baekduia soli]QEC48162.1 folate-binding protein YgfZ [Baekduia soli]
MATLDALLPAYEACTTGCGLVDRSETGKLLLTGDEAATFLDGQVSNATVDLAPGHGCYATLLTNKGRMLGDLRVLATDDGLLLLTERVALQALFDQLRRGLIGWRAELHKRTIELALLSLVGPRAEQVARAAGLPVPGPEEHAVDGMVVRTDLGLDVLPPAAEADATRRALLDAGATEVPEAVAEIVRIERGRPRYGVELDETVMPEEAGIVDRAVSFTKGCYIGQETVARLHWKGRPNRRLRTLGLGAPAAPGDAITADGREVGRVGSAVVSPRFGPLALALVRREVEPGDEVAVGSGDVPAEILAGTAADV